MWQFLNRMAHVTSVYEERQRCWAVYVNGDEEAARPHLPPVARPAARPPRVTTRPIAAAVPVRLQPEAAAARPQTRGHPYHRPDRRQRRVRSLTLDPAAAWAWFHTEDINREESNEDQELDLRSASASQHLQINENEEILKICVICFQRVSNAKTMPCQHRFCRQCIVRWIDEGNAGCPLCRL